VTSKRPARSVLLVAVAVLTVALSACGSSAPTGAGPPASGTAPIAASGSGVARYAGPASKAPFGAGCAAVPASGTGSFSEMAGDRVTTAAAHTSALTRLFAAVVKANLAASLDSQQGITVLAPANAAFAAVPTSSLSQLLGDTARLTRMLTHHVIEGRLPPEQLAGTHTTLANDTVTITGSGQRFGISGDQTVLRSGPATVVCGNIRTANATVYIIDQVLAPRG
jgi:uncharacterized surface protein with fasciclin (FAS1) repeats